MQLTFSCVPPTYGGIAHSLSDARLRRYLGDADGDKHHALRLYVWNGRLCESLYLPVQICEVALRNTIHNAVRSKHGDNWHTRGSFTCTLPDRLREELSNVIRVEVNAYGRNMTVDHLISGLSFGFWLNLMTKKYEGVFWPNAFPICFPRKPPAVTRQEIYDRADRLRILRNRLAHHKPIFDRSPSAEFQNILTLVSWVCDETHWFIKTISNVAQTVNARPTD